MLHDEREELNAKRGQRSIIVNQVVNSVDACWFTTSLHQHSHQHWSSSMLIAMTMMMLGDVHVHEQCHDAMV